MDNFSKDFNLEESVESFESPNSSIDSTASSFSDDKLTRTLEIIQSSSVKTAEVYKGLMYVRKKVVDNPKAIPTFLKSNGLNCLLKMLNHNNSDILNITISILGNLCNYSIMNEEFREKILSNKIPYRLVVILRKIDKVSIRKRLCRFIGNLSQSKAIGRSLHVAGVTILLIDILNRAEDTELQHLAIRALRWLWEIDKYYLGMLKENVVRHVCKFLSSADELVRKVTLRTLVKFTQRCTGRAADQICDQPDIFGVIVNILDEPTGSVLVCNLSYHPRARIELCKAGAVEAIIKRLDSGKTNSYLITSMCQMCRESMVRASLRGNPSGFKTLMTLLMDKKMKHFYIDILDAINQFNYDKPSLMLLVRCGLIGVLIEKLSEYNKSHCIPHSEAVPADSVESISPVSPTWSWAPSPSPPPPLSPHSSSRTANSQDYSPRCSTPTSDSSESSPVPPLERSVSTDRPVSLDGCILDIILALTYQGTPFAALAYQSTITTFLDYLTGLPFPRYGYNFSKATRVLTSIVTCKHNWSTLLDNESVLEIHRRLCRATHEDCWECKRLQETGTSILGKIGRTALSGLGQGELTYRLTGVSAEARTMTALTVPYVISLRSLLRILLFRYKGLSILLNSLDNRIDEAVPSLHSLFTMLSIENPQLPIQLCSGCEIGSIRKEGNVNFTLDDGSTISANKESLSHSCPMFEAMFRGGFKEARESSVRLTDISPECLSHLIKVLPEYCSCGLPKDFRVLLEMGAVSDRFLLPDLTVKIVSVIRDAALNHATVSHIYEWGLTVGQQYEVSSCIADDAIKYLFTAEMLTANRVQAVSKIIESEHKSRFLEDITDIITNAMRAKSPKIC